MLIACVDANGLLSAVAFGGSPERVVDRLLAGEFLHVTGPNILLEVRRNAISKLRLIAVEVDTFLDNIRSASTEYVPSGRQRYIRHSKDSRVLEVALAGGCDVLVTGEREPDRLVVERPGECSRLVLGYRPLEAMRAAPVSAPFLNTYRTTRASPR